MPNYGNLASVATLSAPILSGATSCTVANFSGWPTASFWAIIARGTASAEVVLVTNVAGATLTITRGQGGTVASGHGAGDAVEHIVPAGFFVDTEAHIAAVSGVHGATGSVVGTTDAQTLTNKTYQGAHKSVFSDATPAGITASFESVADSAAARDGFVHKNTAGSATRRGFLLEQSGTPRLEAFNTGQLKLNPSASPGFENDGTTQLDGALTTNSTATLNGAVTVNSTLGVTGASSLAGVTTSGNVSVGGTLGVTGATTLAALTAAATNVSSLTASGAVNGASAAITGLLTAWGGRVVVCVSSLAAITSPATDQLAYLSTDRHVHRYTGSAWEPVLNLSSADRGAAVYTRGHNETQSITNNTVTKVEWVNAEATTSLVTVSGAGNVTFTLNRAGTWAIDFSVPWTGGSGGERWAWVALSSTDTTRYLAHVTAGPSSSYVANSTARQRAFTSGTALSVYAFQNSGSALNIEPRNDLGECHVGFRWMGP